MYKTVEYFKLFPVIQSEGNLMPESIQNKDTNT